MDIDIDTRRNNPLLNRTEIYFTIKHKNENTPNRKIIKTELAEKLNVKKEDIIIDHISTSFGLQRISGYAKFYSSTKKAEDIERKYILERNKIEQKIEKKQEKGEKQSEQLKKNEQSEEKMPRVDDDSKSNDIANNLNNKKE